MRAKLIQLSQDIQASYWFIPAIMAALAMLLSFATLYVDQNIDMQLLRKIQWLYINQPDGARVVLSTIAGSMITVAGVTFSMTIVSVSFASAQFGPRLIGNFMRDKGNQYTLGTFIATFVYCLMVLRAVRSAEEGPVDAVDLIGNFVPHISILCGISMALASVMVLIYFIHHIPETINISNITGSIGNKLRRNIHIMFPESIGEAESNREVISDEEIEKRLENAVPISAKQHGFIETLDEKQLLSIAAKNNLLIRMQYRPGDFSTEYETIMLVASKEEISDGLKSSLRGCFVWGNERTSSQNIMFLVDELLEMIARALSPGINDPYTAMNCMNWLKCTLVELGHRKFPSHLRYDNEGNLRIIAHPHTFDHFCAAVFNGSRQYVSADRNAALHMMKMIADIGADLSPAHKTCLLGYAQKLNEAAQSKIICNDILKEINSRFEDIKRVFTNKNAKEEMRDDQGWLGGKA